jgi:carboxylesterase
MSRAGSDVGVLLCHGFTGSPVSIRGWAEVLAAEGFSVRLPLLPGHGTTWQELNRTGWDDWLHAAQSSLAELAAQCRAVVVAGLSMGGALALRLAQLHPDQVCALVLVNPAVLSRDPRLVLLPLLRFVVPSLAGLGGDIRRPGVDEGCYHRTPLRALHSLVSSWRQTVADLPKVSQPVLLAHSVEDHVVPAESSELILKRISSVDVEELVCRDSYHVATLDYDAAGIERASVDFIRRVAAGSVPAGRAVSTGQGHAGQVDGG